MNPFYRDLAESIKTGFLDQAIPCNKEHLPQLLVNANGKKVITTLLKELSECQEFWFSVAFVTKGGVATIINALEALEEKGIPGKILASQYQFFTEPEALKTLSRFGNIQLKMAVEGDFHAKGYIFKKEKGFSLVIGSSNLTDKALCANKEWNLKVSATENSTIIQNVLGEFNREFDCAQPVDTSFIEAYQLHYQVQKRSWANQFPAIAAMQPLSVQPNKMQVAALANIRLLREQQKDKALLISATATGKTYLSAFDVKSTDAKRCLFIVHRANIAAAAMESFRRIFGTTRTMGMFSGEKKELTADFLFCTVQTLSQDVCLQQFDARSFDYIVIDETHRSGAASYQKILAHFSPKFLLGMTATPERTDGFDIFKQFDHNIAYEIRLQKALAEDMLCPFHYYGITDIIHEERSLKEDIPFRLLASSERVDTIIEKAAFYGCDNGCVRGLVFCSSVKESTALSKAFNERGFKTVSLSGEDSEEKRVTAISQLEHADDGKKLDYLFTVDIFNEGIDIPKVNQIILLRPTQSAIVFVQQLGRGLRKADDKSYLTIIDFIGNYSNNFLVPIALFGDTTYNKDNLRKLMTSGNSLLPGASTVHFDRISCERIFKAIDSANLSLRKDLAKDFHLVKHTIGRSPMMMDFLEHGSRDPYQYVKYEKSFFNFSAKEEDGLQLLLSAVEIKLLELFSLHIANGKRIEEVVILKTMLDTAVFPISLFKAHLFEIYGIRVSDATITSCIYNINFSFINTEQRIIYIEDAHFNLHPSFQKMLKNEVFRKYFADALTYAQATFDAHFSKEQYVQGFILYQKYSRKDVCRILNWDRDEHSTMYGYKIKHGTCPIFVNYHKEEDIASTTKYQDHFINNGEFEWMSRSRRTLASNEIAQIRSFKYRLRLCLFIKKSNDEGEEFYYISDVIPTHFEETTIADDNKQPIPIVKVRFLLDQPVEDSIFTYLISAGMESL